jgi:hypothetical protein
MSALPPLFDFSYDERMPRFTAERWGYGPPRGTVAIGVACVLLAVGSAGLLAARGLLISRSPDVVRERGREDGGLPPMRPTDRRQVDRAYADVRRLFTAEGVPALAREGAACFAELERKPDYARLDYCIAFDAFANGVYRVTGARGGDAVSYFNDAPVRHIRATDAVGASRGEASLRVTEIGRMAAQVSRDNLKTAPLIIAPPPPEPVEAPVVEAPPAQTTPPPADEAPPYRAVGPETPPLPADPAAGAQPTPTPAPAPAPASTTPPPAPG